MPMSADDTGLSPEEYRKALSMIDAGSVVQGANKLHEYLKRTQMSDFSYADMQLTVDAMEKLILALVIDMASNGLSSFECPEYIIRLHGWRKK